MEPTAAGSDAEEEKIEISLRPTNFDEYIGQEHLKRNLKLAIDAVKKRADGSTLDHVLLYGPPGLGKTTMAGVIAHELGASLRVTSGPAIERAGDLASILTNLKDGDVIIGMASTGVHSNGFSLVRKIFNMDKETLDTYYDELGTTLGEALIAPTRIYVKALKAVKAAGVTVKACSHITGGGFQENVPRMLPEGKHAVIEKNSYEVPALFKLMAEKGNVEEDMMYNTYNMGIGMMVCVDPADAETAMEAMRSAGDTPYVIGKIVDGEKGVTLC